MTLPIIEVDNISKRYHLGRREPYFTLRDSLSSMFKKRMISQLKDKQFWALKDISFKVMPGEILGIIGANGAGKSTLLKILSRITIPTTGQAILRGRVASLLEVGTGFSPELTGRENIFLNGAVLGMGQKEIKQKYHKIVDFSEIGKFIDTPVKYYSSGMYMRLAFAVAAHLDPEILIVDEVLSVGDLRFQKKSLGKIEGLTKDEGRTVLFVSHNLGAVNQLCRETILLENGRIAFRGPTEEAIRLYSRQNTNSHFRGAFAGDLASVLALEKIIVNNKKSLNLAILPKEKVEFKMTLKARRKIPKLTINLSLYKEGIRLFTMSDTAEPKDQPKGTFQSVFRLPAHLLRPGYYSIALGGYRAGSTEWSWGTDLAGLTVVEIWDVKNVQPHLGVFNVPNNGERRNDKNS